MTEDLVSSETRRVLKERGFFVLKTNDASTKGVPDMHLAKGGRMLWVEDKIIKLQFGIGGALNVSELEYLNLTINARDFIQPERMSQMANMVKLEKQGKAQYWLYIENTCNGSLFVAVLSPRMVFDSFRLNESFVVIHPKPVNVFRRTFEIE